MFLLTRATLLFTRRRTEMEVYAVSCCRYCHCIVCCNCGGDSLFIYEKKDTPDWSDGAFNRDNATIEISGRKGSRTRQWDDYLYQNVICLRVLESWSRVVCCPVYVVVWQDTLHVHPLMFINQKYFQLDYQLKMRGKHFIPWNQPLFLKMWFSRGSRSDFMSIICITD